MAGPVRCAALGHSPEFEARGGVLLWRCRRCGEPLGEKDYGDPDRARRYATAFGRRESDQLGRNAPLVGLFPLRIAHALRSRRRR
jgi:hypothetical protein